MTDSGNDIGAPRGEFIQTLSGADITPELTGGHVWSPEQSTSYAREDLFNEIIVGLDVLYRSTKAGDYPYSRGILFALDYVKAMKELEQ